MSRTVLVSLDHQKLHQELVTYLESGESAIELEISQNIETQAALLYFLPKVKPHTVIVSDSLPGDLSSEQLQSRIMDIIPGVQIIVYRGDFAPIGEHLLRKVNVLKKVISVWSPCGGVGKTEIAKNLALAAGTDYRVILLDANLCNPDIAEHLGIGYKKGHTLSAALELWTENRLTTAALRSLLHPFGSIQVLVGSEQLIEQTDYSPAFFRDLVKTLSQMADLVIVDMDSDITSPAGVSILLASSHIVTPFNTMVTTLGQGKVYMDLLMESYQVNPAKFDPILNRAGEGGTVMPEDIEVCVKRPVLTSIPYNKAHLRAACKAEPLVLGKGAVSRRLFQTFRKIARQYAEKEVKQL